MREIRIKVPDRKASGSDRQLLLYCACAAVVETDQVRIVAQQIVDWAALAEAAEYHGLSANLSRVIEGTCSDLVPDYVMSSLRDARRDSARRNLILTSQLFALLDAFKAADIAVVPLKGPVLAELLYPDPGLRPFSDLDILVRKPDVPAVIRVLTQQGYALGNHLKCLHLDVLLSLQNELIFHHVRLASVDIQWGIGPSHFPFRFDTEILLRSLSTTQVAGREVPSLTPESMLLFLCVHGAKHMWSRFQWLGDVARLARTQLDWAGVAGIATEARCVRPLLLGLLLAHELLDAPVPERFLGLSLARPQPSNCGQRR